MKSKSAIAIAALLFGVLGAQAEIVGFGRDGPNETRFPNGATFPYTQTYTVSNGNSVATFDVTLDTDGSDNLYQNSGRFSPGPWLTTNETLTLTFDNFQGAAITNFQFLTVGCYRLSSNETARLTKGATTQEKDSNGTANGGTMNVQPSLQDISSGDTYTVGTVAGDGWRINGMTFQVDVGNDVGGGDPTVGPLSIASLGSDVVISWDAGAEGMHTLQTRTNLTSGTWSNMVDLVPGVETTLSVTSTPTEAESFFRVIAE